MRRWYVTAAICHVGADDAAGTPSSSSSSSPSPAFPVATAASQTASSGDIAFIVSGAGSSSYNGEYKKEGSKNGKPKYRRVGHESASCNYSSNNWYLCPNFSGAAYKIKADDANFPNRPAPGKAWTKCSSGDLPVPTVAYPAAPVVVGDDESADGTGRENVLLKLAKMPHGQKSRTGLNAIEYRFATIMSGDFSGPMSASSTAATMPSSAVSSATPTTTTTTSQKNTSVADIPDLLHRDSDSTNAGKAVTDALEAVQTQRAYSAFKFKIFQRMMAAAVRNAETEKCALDSEKKDAIVSQTSATLTTKHSPTYLHDEEDMLYEDVFMGIREGDDDEDDESPTRDDFMAWSTGKNITGKQQFEDDIPNATNQAMLATNLCLSLSLVQGTKAYDQTIFLDCVEQLHTLVHNLPAESFQSLSSTPWSANAIQGIIAFCKKGEDLETFALLVSIAIKMGDLSELLSLSLRLRTFSGGTITAKRVSGICRAIYQNRPTCLKTLGLSMFESACYKGEQRVSARTCSEALAEKNKLDITDSSNYALASDGMFLYVRTATGVLKVGTGSFSSRAGRIYGWLPHRAVSDLFVPTPRSASGASKMDAGGARGGSTSTTSMAMTMDAHSDPSMVVVDIIVAKRAASIGLELGLVDGAVCVMATCNFSDGSVPDHVRDLLFWAGDHVIKINDTVIDSLDVCSIIVQTTPESDPLTLTVQRTRACEEKRLAKITAQEIALATPPLPPRELTPGWLASVAVADPTSPAGRPGVEKVLVQSERRAGFVSLIDTISMARVSTSPIRLVGGTLMADRDDSTANIMPILSDGIFLYVLDMTAPASTFVNIFRATGSMARGRYRKKPVMPESIPGSKWSSVRTNQGDYYYYHRETRDVTWNTPAGFTPMVDEEEGAVKTNNGANAEAVPSQHTVNFALVRCVKLSWTIAGADNIIPAGELRNFGLKSSFFTNGVRLHALFQGKMLCWSLKKGVVKMSGTDRPVVPGEVISYADVVSAVTWNLPQCQVAKDGGETKGHSVPVCFDHVKRGGDRCRDSATNRPAECRFERLEWSAARLGPLLFESLVDRELDEGEWDLAHDSRRIPNIEPPPALRPDNSGKRLSRGRIDARLHLLLHVLRRDPDPARRYFTA